VNPELLERIKNQKSFPTIPQVALEVVRLCEQEEVSIPKLGEVVSRDPAVASRLIRMANSPIFGSPRKIGSLPQAISMLGLRTVRVVTLSSAIIDGIEHRRIPGFDYARFWRGALASGLGSRALAALVGIRAPEEAFLAGLVQDLGVYALAIAMRESYLPLLAEAMEKGSDLTALEEERLGVSHAEVSAALLEDWGFPDGIVGAVRQHGRGPANPSDRGVEARTASCLCVGERVGRIFQASSPFVVAVGQLDELGRSLLGLTREQVSEVFGYVQQNMGEMSRMLNLNVGSLDDLLSVREKAQEMLVQLSLESEKAAVTAEKEKESARRQARTDALTGAPNRGAVEAELDRCLADTEARRWGLAVAILDLDHFKRVNDTHGHAAGDAVLRSLAGVIGVCVPANAHFGRYGGEEFLVVLPQVLPAAARDTVERIRRNVESLRVDIGKREISVTLSAGVSWVAPGEARPKGAILEEADRALYAAKAAGRNRVLLASDVSGGVGQVPPPFPAKGRDPSRL
jgi:diguanylate cyclase (GGDEF)-like protein